jgi:hypothetical protein
MGEAPEWSKLSQLLSCNSETLSTNGLGGQDYFAVVYHCTTSVKSRCHKNSGRMEDSSSFLGETITSTRTSSGHQLAVRFSSTPDGKIEMTVCSDDPEELSRRMVEYKERIRTLSEQIMKMDEEGRKRIVLLILVEMKVDAAIDKILSKRPAGEIYPAVGIIRETLIKTLAGFDPIHIETGEMMEALHGYSPDTSLDREKSVSFGVKLLDWRRRLSRIVDGERSSSWEPSEQQHQPQT